MFAKRLIEKAINRHRSNHHQHNAKHGDLTPGDLDFQISLHYGIPSTASVLAFDPIQRLLAIGTLDGRIKVIGGDGIEGLLISSRQLAFKSLEFMQNHGFLVSISIENDVQIWNLETRCLACSMQWESNITAFSVINGAHFMYMGDEYGFLSVLKYDAEGGTLSQLPYQISPDALSKAAEVTFPDAIPIVGILPQPYSSGNRVLIAYENGLITLLDVSEDRVLFVGGGKDLELKDGEYISPPENTSDQRIQDKEISALCWASSNGFILAVGYVDGDILFWNTSSATSASNQQAGLSANRNIVKLQLSSAERRLPVIVLHWSLKDKSHNGCDGKLFIYGGDEIGGEEVLTVLSLEWSSGIETVSCSGRLDISLNGSFCDMNLVPSAGAMMGACQKADLVVLASPGELQLYDDATLSAALSQQERKASVSALRFPVVVPTVHPSLTSTKLIVLPCIGDSSKILSEIASAARVGFRKSAAHGTQWPLTGGVPSQLSFTNDTSVERMFMTGYEDGSVRLWDASFPVLSLIFCFGGEGIRVDGSSAPVSNLDFFFPTLCFAVGNERGVVRIYNLNGNLDQTNIFLVTETKREGAVLESSPQGKGPHCTAVFSLVSSPVRILQFANSEAKLAVGFESGHVAVLHTTSSSVLFLKDFLCGSPVISITWKDYTNADYVVKNPNNSGSKTLVNAREEVIFVLTKDSKVNIMDDIDGTTFNSQGCHLKKESVALSMYIIEDNAGSTNVNCQEETGPDLDGKDESVSGICPTGQDTREDELHSSSESSCARERLLNSLVLICCEDSVRLYSTKNIIQENEKAIRKVVLKTSCCWTSIIKKAEEVCGLALLFNTGVIEIRSFPDLEVVQESSLMSILRWSFKPNMDKMMGSDCSGHMTLANGHELAFISMLSGDTAFRIPESLPCLHDKVLAAAADAALCFSSNQKKQGPGPGIIGGIIRGFKGGNPVQRPDSISIPTSNFTHLEDKFSKFPFNGSSPAAAIELDIDDIEIDESPGNVISLSHEVKDKGKSINTEKETDRQKLFGANDDATPRPRTLEEIKARYRKTGDASSAAADARNKLLERQEKLEKISQRTEELQSGAQDFASLANELVKVMEGRNAKKWWHL